MENKAFMQAISNENGNILVCNKYVIFQTMKFFPKLEETIDLLDFKKMTH